MGAFLGKSFYTEPYVDVAVLSAKTAGVVGVLAWRASTAQSSADLIVEMSKVAFGKWRINTGTR